MTGASLQSLDNVQPGSGGYAEPEAGVTRGSVAQRTSELDVGHLLAAADLDRGRERHRLGSEAGRTDRVVDADLGKSGDRHVIT